MERKLKDIAIALTVITVGTGLIDLIKLIIECM